MAQALRTKHLGYYCFSRSYPETDFCIVDAKLFEC